MQLVRSLDAGGQFRSVIAVYERAELSADTVNLVVLSCWGAQGACARVASRIVHRIRIERDDVSTPVAYIYRGENSRSMNRSSNSGFSGTVPKFSGESLCIPCFTLETVSGLVSRQRRMDN